MHSSTGPPARVAALVLEGEAGIGKSTLWLAGVEAARERGLRVLSSRPAEVELGVAHAALGDLLEDALADVLAGAGRPATPGARDRAAARRRSRTSRSTAERSPWPSATCCSCSPSVGRSCWRSTTSSGSTPRPRTRWRSRCRRLPDHEHPPAPTHRTAGGGNPLTELELALDDRNVERLRVGPLSPGALHAILQRPARPRVRTADLAPPARGIGRESRSLRSSSPVLSATNIDHDAAAAGPGDARGARPRAARRACRTRRASPAARVRARPDLKPAHLDGDALEPAFADGVIELAEGSSASRTRCSPPSSTRPRRRASSAERARSDSPRSSTTSSRAHATVRLPRASRTPPSPRSSRQAGSRRDRTRRADRRGGAVRARRARDAGRRTRKTASDARSSPPTPTWRPERARVLARSRPSSWRRRSAGPARAEALVLLAELEGAPTARSRSSRTRSRGGRERRRCRPRCTGGWPSTDDSSKGMSWSQRHARAALELAEALGDDALRAGALSTLALPPVQRRRCRDAPSWRSKRVRARGCAPATLNS